MTPTHTHKILNGIPQDRLNTDQEQLLARVIRGKSTTANEKQAARNMLILHAMWEAFFYARRCCRLKLPDDEIYSLSYDALCKAVGNFRPGKIRFFAYAKVYVRGAICKEWKKKDVVKNSSSHESLMLEDDLYSSVGHHPDVDADYDSGAGIRTRGTHPNGVDHATFRSKKLLPDVAEPDFSSIRSREVWATLEPVLQTRLNPHEQKVIQMAYSEGLNFQEIGNKLGVSRAAIHTTHDRAIKRLRCVLSHKKELLLGTE